MNVNKQYVVEMMSDGAIRCSSRYGNEEETIFDNDYSITDLKKFLQKN